MASLLRLLNGMVEVDSVAAGHGVTMVWPEGGRVVGVATFGPRIGQDGFPLDRVGACVSVNERVDGS